VKGDVVTNIDLHRGKVLKLGGEKRSETELRKRNNLTV
jgi:hypothetical protein